MRWLVTGGTGQLGRSLLLAIPRHDLAAQIFAPTRVDLDLSDMTAVRRHLEDVRPDIIVNAAAWTDVDGAEFHVNEAFCLNASLPSILAEWAGGQARVTLIHFSTDYVFDGANGPYLETAIASPLSVYGTSKLQGEQRVRSALPTRSLILRTSALYSNYGPNFVSAILNRMLRGEELRVVNDQYCQPTWAHDLAEASVDLVLRLSGGLVPAGVYHATNGGHATWWEFARVIVKSAGGDLTRLTPIRSADLDRPARRPTCPVLTNSLFEKYSVTPLRDWRRALSQALPAFLSSE